MNKEQVVPPGTYEEHLCAADAQERSPKVGDHEYRIVRDRIRGFEVQRRKRLRWWWGPWRQWEVNTHSTIEDAEQYALKAARCGSGRVVKVLGNLSLAARASGLASPQGADEGPGRNTSSSSDTGGEATDNGR